MRAEKVKAELKSIIAEFFTEVEKLMDQGQSFELAVMNICKNRPDLVDRENSLRDHLKALGHIDQSLSAADLRAWSECKSAGSISCAAVTKLAGAARRLPLAMLGVRYKGSQKIEITRAMLAEVVANFRKRDTKELPIDYEHASEEPEVAGGGPVPAAGWLKSIDDAPDADGILWGTVEWTPRAAALIAAREYKYISPFIDPTVRDNKTGKPQGWTLTSAALTNRPVLQGMPALALSERGRVEREEATNVNDNRVMGYTDQDWNPVQLEITRRAKQLMAADKTLDYAGAEDAVHQADPSLAQKDWDAIQTELARRIKEMMAAHGQLSYAHALHAVITDDANLSRRYYAAKNRVLSTPGVHPRGNQDGEISLEIQPLVQAKMAASEGRMNYGAALKAVFGERPDLAQRYRNAIR